MESVGEESGEEGACAMERDRVQVRAMLFQSLMGGGVGGIPRFTLTSGVTKEYEPLSF